MRETFDFIGTPIKFSFRDEKQIKANKERVAKGLEPITKKSRLEKLEKEKAALAKLNDE
jgi:hypothetical protein